MARRQGAAASGSTPGHIISPVEHPLVWDYVGTGRYLQVAVSKAIAQIYATKFGPVTSKKLSIIAARDGWLELLMWARSIGCVWDPNVFKSACEGNRINILEQLVGDMSLRPWRVGAYIAASTQGHIPVIQWLREHNFEWDDDVCAATAAYGQLETLKFLIANGCPCKRESICEDACRGNQLTVLQWLHDEQGCSLTLKTGHVAAKCSSLEILQWLHANNAPFDEITSALAGRFGGLDKLQYLRSRDCPWDHRTVGWSQELGQHDIAQWAIENGCPEPAEDAADY